MGQPLILSVERLCDAAQVGQPQILSVFPPLILSMQDYTKWWEPNEGMSTIPEGWATMYSGSTSCSLGSENALMLTGNAIEIYWSFFTSWK